MSEITLFNQDLPDYLKGVELDAVTKALVGNSGSKRISLRGGKFRMVVNGEEILTSNSDSLNVVIVNAALQQLGHIPEITYSSSKQQKTS